MHTVHAEAWKMKRIGILLLAAGAGKRFGGNKLEALVHGKPMFLHALDLIEKQNVLQKVVVTGKKKIALEADRIITIDDGKIIIQDKFRIKDGSTAFDVNKEQNLLGFELFKKFILKYLEYPESFINDNKSITHEKMQSRYFAKGVLPDGGYLNLEDTKEHIDRVLRAFDYKCILLNLPLKVEFENTVFAIESYTANETSEDDRCYLEDGYLYLIKEGTQFKIKIRT